MKRALIDGTRICQIVKPGEEFEVAKPLKWVDVANDTVVDRDIYKNGAVVKAKTPPKSKPKSKKAK